MATKLVPWMVTIEQLGLTPDQIHSLFDKYIGIAIKKLSEREEVASLGFADGTPFSDPYFLDIVLGDEKPTLLAAMFIAIKLGLSVDEILEEVFKIAINRQKLPA